MTYAELVKQAADIAGLSDIYSSAMNATEAQKAFDVLLTSLLALNSDDRLTFAVDDIALNLAKPKLVLTPDAGYEPAHDEQALITDFPVEIPPAYIIANQLVRMDMASYELFLTRHIGNIYVYAIRFEYRKTTLHFRIGGEIKIGIKKALDTPAQMTDEARLTGSALNLLKYKLATELCAAYGIESSKEIEQKYAECIARHNNSKAEMLPPPVLHAHIGWGARDIIDGGL